jgi:hypothetical protein
VPLLLLPGLARATVGGPDAFGYRWVDNQDPQGPEFDWIMQDQGLEDVEVPVDGAAEVDLPFPFRFYGQDRDRIWVGEDGVAGFGEMAAGPQNDCQLDAAEARIALFWDDLDMADGNIAAGVVGEPPDRRFVVSWRFAHPAGSDSFFWFQIHFPESGRGPLLQLRDVTSWGDASGGARATVGIGAAGLGNLVVSCNSGVLLDWTAIRFEPPEEEPQSSDDDSADPEGLGEQDDDGGGAGDYSGGPSGVGDGCTCIGTGARFGACVALAPGLGGALAARRRR